MEATSRNATAYAKTDPQSSRISTTNPESDPKVVAKRLPADLTPTVAASLVEPTPTVKKTNIAGDVIKAAPAGIDVARNYGGFNNEAYCRVVISNSMRRFLAMFWSVSLTAMG